MLFMRLAIIIQLQVNPSYLDIQVKAIHFHFQE